MLLLLQHLNQEQLQRRALEASKVGLPGLFAHFYPLDYQPSQIVISVQMVAALVGLC